MVHGSLCQDFTGDGVHPVKFVAGICDNSAIHKNRTANCIGINAAANFIGPVQGSRFRSNRQRCVCNCIIAVAATEIGPGRHDRCINGTIHGCLSKGPGYGNCASISLLCYHILILAIQYYQFIGIISCHCQDARFAYITVLCECIVITIAFTELVVSIFIRPQAVSGQDLANIQQCLSRREFKSCIHRRRLQDMYHISGCSIRSF